MSKSTMSKLCIAVLDDFQYAARKYGDWDSLDAEVVVFHEPFLGAEAVVTALAAFDVVVAMRERTGFPAEVLRGLKRLKLLVTTAPANAAIDVGAANEQGVVDIRSSVPPRSSPGR
jgi:phosphoglycerate dehydrogenase-like enzyme